MRRPIAVREFIEPPHGRVTVSLFEPTQTDDSRWVCDFTIEGLRISGPTQAKGIDQFNALINALELIRRQLLSAESKITWEYGLEGDLGFPRILLNVLGVTFNKHLDTIIDKEAETYVNALKQKAKERPTAGAQDAK